MDSEEFNPNITYPGFQATHQAGGWNLTVRAETADAAAKSMAELKLALKAQISLKDEIKDLDAVPVDAPNAKKCSCGSPMTYVSAKGTVSARWKCTNPTHQTMGKDGKMYAFTEWIK